MLRVVFQWTVGDLEKLRPALSRGVRVLAV
jgi:hypothetical protein